MRVIKTILIISILTSCGQQRSDDVTLIFPTGRYVDWTNFELIHMSFKLQNESILIDSNYDFENKDFIKRGVEKSDNYPETTKFLKKKLTDYETLAMSIETAFCSRMTPIYVEYKSGRESKLISLKTIAECKNDKDSIPNIVMELQTLRRKYLR